MGNKKVGHPKMSHKQRVAERRKRRELREKIDELLNEYGEDLVRNSIKCRIYARHKAEKERRKNETNETSGVVK